MQHQLDRQRHLAAACRRLGLGHQTPDFKNSDMYINDTFNYLYCVVNKVVRDGRRMCCVAVNYWHRLGLHLHCTTE